MALEGLQLGQYRLLRLLGSGGMGEVYLAEDARIDQDVAIKVSRTEANSYPNSSTMQETVRLFQREAKAIARLDHPHVLSLLSYGEEQVIGTSTASVSHAIRGTPAYMAPEQWSGEPVYATDQYALAILAYELLTGHLPFAGRQEQVMYQHFHVQPQPPSAFNPRLSRDIDAVILKALAKHPEERFLSIAACADAFREAIAGLDASTMIKPLVTPNKSDALLASPTLPYTRDRTVSVTKPDRLEQTTNPTRRSSEAAIPLSSSFAPTSPETHHPSSNEGQRGISTGTAILLVGLALVLLFGGFGFYYLHTMNPSPSTTTPQNGGTITGSSTSPTQTLTTNATAPSTEVNATTTASALNSATATASAVNSTPSVVATAPGSYVQLQHSYSGTASGKIDGNITFTLNSEDQQGHVTMNTTFQQVAAPQKIASYTCQGSVTLDRHLTLQCINMADQTYILTIQGYVYPDGHMEGTEIATIINDPSYNHMYSWKAY